jgi:replication factor C subunit 2/4
MRQAVNNLQSTFSGFGIVTPDNVFKVCDQPHPLAIQQCIAHCLDSKIDAATDIIRALAGQGYSSIDLVGTLFKVVKAYANIPEYLKLEYIRVGLLFVRIPALLQP